MGLSFLNKKIWHPGSFANMEKTWVTEQKYREVEIRAIEKAKKIKEEKVLEEMKKIQVNKGLIPASQLNRLDFMYQCPDPEANQKTTPNEDFLLGKRIIDETNNIFMKKKNQKKNIIPMFADNYANPRNEDFVRIHEDPLYLILKEEKRQRKEIEQNPYKMKMILNDIKNDFKDSLQYNIPFEDKNELYKNNKSNIIKLKEDDELKRSRSLRENNSDSDEETEKYNNYKKEKIKKIKKDNDRIREHKHRKSKEKYKEKYHKESKEKYENRKRDKNRDKYEHKHSDRGRENYKYKYRDKSKEKYIQDYREKSSDKKNKKYYY